jgi:Cu(I)/Ag(I) efflux system membrane fusion protein
MNRTLVVTAIAVAASAGVGYFAYEVGTKHGQSMASPSPAAHSQSVASAPGAGERKILYWHDPMVPGPRFDKPGKSPYMDMELVPVYADDAEGAGVSVGSAMAQNLGLRTTTVRRGSAAASVEAVGVVTQNERATVVVQSRVSGYVEKLFVRATLDPVSKGQPLVTIFAPEWAGALSEYLGLRTANIDPAIVAAARQRLKLLSIPDDVVAQAEREGATQSRFTLTAPIAGVVAELGVREGVMVQPGMALFRIVDLSTVWVEASIPEGQAAQIRVGAPAQARSDAYPGRAFSGTASAILPQVDAATRTLRARVELKNPAIALKPGMFVSVTFAAPSGEPVLLVPQVAVIATGRRNVVIVAGDDRRYAPVEVTLGRPVDSDVEIKAGLSEGQRVVTSGQFLVDSEASLKSTVARFEPVAQTSSTAAAAPPTHRATGRIEKIGKDEVTISHDPIPELGWPPMTMGFKSPPAGIPKGLKAGDTVQFEFQTQGRTYQLTRIESARPGTKP